jgi:hypothetical protein
MLRCQEARRRLKVPDVSIRDPLVEGYTDFAGRLVEHLDALAETPVTGTGSTDRRLAEGAR